MADQLEAFHGRVVSGMHGNLPLHRLMPSQLIHHWLGTGARGLGFDGSPSVVIPPESRLGPGHGNSPLPWLIPSQTSHRSQGRGRTLWTPACPQPSRRVEFFRLTARELLVVLVTRDRAAHRPTRARSDCLSKLIFVPVKILKNI